MLRNKLSILVFTICHARSIIGLPSSHKPVVSADAFTYNSTTFLLHGEPYQIRAGQMDPQRIHPAYWHDRLFKAKALGLNTIFSYVFWDLIEPQQGSFDFTGRNDIGSYFRQAQEVGLNIVLRPGSYACAERDWGGFPAWLLDVEGMEVRTDNTLFLGATSNYLSRLADEVRDLQVTHGGPILMAQVENEYGSYGSNHAYIAALRDIFRDNFDVPLFTDDGGGESYLNGGQIHGVLAEVDGDPKTGFEAREKYVTDPTSLGPLLDAEYYTTWLDLWASNYSHQTTAGDPKAKKAIYDDIDWILSHNDSFSLYMFHGGTNFGFENGALRADAGYLEPVTSSYDYGAPLDESGRTTGLYDGLREVIMTYVTGEEVPDVPENVPLMELPDMKLDPVAGLFDREISGKPIMLEHPATMEALGQQFGYVLYEHTATSAVKGAVQPGDYPRDRVIVFVNDKRMGISDSVYTDWTKVNVTLRIGDKLQLLVENLGRVDYGETIPDQHRGILGQVTVGGTSLRGWNIYTLHLDDVGSISCQHGPSPSQITSTSPPIFYKAMFKSPAGVQCGMSDPQHDTFLSISNGTKGQVWVNGFNLGRYWIVGPQQSLYMPAPVLKDAGEENEILVLELEPRSGIKMMVRGLSKRAWANHPDPDKPKRR